MQSRISDSNYRRRSFPNQMNDTLDGNRRFSSGSAGHEVEDNIHYFNINRSNHATEMIITDRMNPHWRLPKDVTVGYAGHHHNHDDPQHILDKALKKQKIGGYTGYMPDTKNMCGCPIIKFKEPSHPLRIFADKERQREVEEQMNSTTLKSRRPCSASTTTTDSSSSSNGSFQSVPRNTYRIYNKHLDIEDRYREAIKLLKHEKNQSQQALLRVLQAKFSEKVLSYAQQQIFLRKLFEGFDRDLDGYLNETEFRECLENQNVQYDDIQIVALFAYFDRNNLGLINWKDFSENSMVYNPKGGTAVLPKMIIQASK